MKVAILGFLVIVSIVGEASACGARRAARRAARVGYASAAYCCEPSPVCCPAPAPLCCPAPPQCCEPSPASSGCCPVRARELAAPVSMKPGEPTLDYSAAVPQPQPMAD